MKKVYVELQVKLVLKVDEDSNVDISDVINEMDYNFESVNPNAIVYDSTIEDFSVSGKIKE